MKLSIKDRVLLPGILPQSGKIIEMTICSGIVRKVEFKPEDIDKYEMQDRADGGVRWNPQRAEDIEVFFTETEVKTLKASVSKLDAEGRVTLDLLPLCEKINDL